MSLCNVFAVVGLLALAVAWRLLTAGPRSNWIALGLNDDSDSETGKG